MVNTGFQLPPSELNALTSTDSSINDLTTSRNLNTIYQNKTNKIMFFYGSIELKTPLSTDAIDLAILVDNVNPPLREPTDMTLLAGVANRDMIIPFFALVPAGYYYELLKTVISGTGNAILSSWVEGYLD
jgi:hypothetical protein